MKPTRYINFVIIAALAAACATARPTPPPIPTPTPTVAPTPVPGMTRAQAEALIVPAYRELLFRAPDPFGLEFYGSRLMDGRMTDATMREDIKASPEYKGLHPEPGQGRTVPPVITIIGKQFFADGKPWSPALRSGLNLLAKPPPERDAFLNETQAIGFDGVRVFAGELRPWADQTPEIARANLPALLDALASRGLAIEVTILTGTGTGYDAKAHLIAVADILKGRKGILSELANEITNSGSGNQDPNITAEVLKRWGREIFTPRGLLWAVGATDIDEPCPPMAPDRTETCDGYDEGVYPAQGGDYSTAHLDRGRPSWNNVRRVREIFAIADSSGRPSINNEPMGADELDGSVTGKQRWNDPALFFAIGALERAFSIGGVHHSEAGRYSVLSGPVQLACAKAYVAGHKAVDGVLQGQVGSYRNINHTGSPIINANIGDDGVVRAYSFIVGNIGVTVVVGMGPNPRIEWGNGWPPGAEVAAMTGQDGRRVVVLALKR
jgi:hypothetical protein